MWIVLFLFLFAFLSFVPNTFPFQVRSFPHRPPSPPALRGFHFPSIQDSDSQSHHLIIVPGHAALKIEQLKEALHSDSAWYLLPYQLHQSFPHIISSHIQRGISLLQESPEKNTTLIFSGGQTRRDVGPISEAASYYYLALQNQWIPPQDLITLKNKIYLEENARDSYENLLFSICRYKEINNHYPTKISIVGFYFKEKRYLELHGRAIRFPPQNLKYYGLVPNKDSLFDARRAEEGESLTLKEFTEDMYACHTESLRRKRNTRNPFLRTIPYELSCPELKELLTWCGPELFNGPLPWS